MKKLFLVLVVAVCMVGCSPMQAEQGSSDSSLENIDLNALRAKILKMRREMDRLIKDVVATTPAITDAAFGELGQDVRVDVVENENNIVVTADLPGMSKDKIEITLEQGKTLTIAGSREMVKKETAPGMVRQERLVGSFRRVIDLPAECLNEGIKASYKDGVLVIDIPKKKVPKKESIKVKVL